MNAPRQKLRHPPLAYWAFEYGVGNAEAAAEVGVSQMQFSRYCRPFGDPRRQVPSQTVMERIRDMTAGEILPVHHYPPELSGRPDDEAGLQKARAS